MEDRAAVIVAGGKGLRMGGEIPKQYLPIKGHPVLAYTIAAFEESCADEIILVVPKGGADYVRTEIVERYGFRKVTAITEGGAERFDSVYRGLKAADARGLRFAAVHDGARPLVTPELIRASFEAAERHGGAAAAVAVKDTIRRINEDGTAGETIDRGGLRAMQTPQTFELARLLAAYETMFSQPGGTVGVTDDVMVAAAYGGLPAVLIEGDYRNLKITTSEDLEAAERWIAERMNGADSRFSGLLKSI